MSFQLRQHRFVPTVVTDVGEVILALCSGALGLAFAIAAVPPLEIPGLAVDLALIFLRLVWIQLRALCAPARSLREWAGFQFEVFRLLWLLDRVHRVEVALDRRLGYGVLSAELPHVDTASSGRNQRPLKHMKGGAMEQTSPVVRDLVLVGGGHSHAFVLKSLGMNPIPGVQVTLITRDIDTPYSGMLPAHVAGHYSRAECHIDLGRLARFAKARLVHAEAVAIDRERCCVVLRGPRPDVPYDVLSINIGSSPQMLPQSGLHGSRVPLTPVKPISGFAAQWDALRERVASLDAFHAGGSSAKTRPIVVGVVGAGAGGVELTLSMQYRLERELSASGRDPALVRFVLFTRGRHIMPSHSRLVRRKFKRILTKRGVQVLTDFEVGEVCGDLVKEKAKAVPSERNSTEGSRTPTPTSPRAVRVDECVWCTQASAQPWLRESGLATDDAGFVAVHPTLESINSPGVFAAGDIAAVLKYPRPKAGVFAVRQGPPLARNLRAALLGERVERFIPQSRFLGIIGTGDANAVASKGEMALEGEWLWKLKDWIDRKWMAGYTSHLPLMPEPESDIPDVARAAGPRAIKQLSELAMRCGGCGAKVGATVLERAMKKLRAPTRPEVVVGLDSPDDCAVVNYNAPSLRQTSNEAASSSPSASPKKSTAKATANGGSPRGNGLSKHGATGTGNPMADFVRRGAEKMGFGGQSGTAVNVVHSVDFFRSFIGDPYVFGQVAAVHSMSDCHAMGCDAVSALAVAVVPYAIDSKVQDTLHQMMAGACAALEADGCALVGGHTCEGVELSLGFAINGVLPPGGKGGIMQKGGAIKGQALVLTKALGTGVIFAADMRVKAKGVWVEHALRRMTTSNANGSKVFARKC